MKDQQHKTQTDNNNSNAFATRVEYAKHRRVSARTVDTWTADGVIPVLRYGRKCIRIPVEAADKALEKRFLVKGGVA